jgi:hypothetical protein
MLLNVYKIYEILHTEVHQMQQRNRHCVPIRQSYFFLTRRTPDKLVFHEHIHSSVTGQPDKGRRNFQTVLYLKHQARGDPVSETGDFSNSAVPVSSL